MFEPGNDMLEHLLPQVLILINERIKPTSRRTHASAVVYYLKKMKRAKVYHWNFCDLETFKFTRPKPGENFFKELEIDVGIEGKEGTDRFTISICNEGGLLDLIHRIHGQYNFAELNHVLIFKVFDEDMIVEKVRSRIEKVSGKDWVEIANRISTFMDNEFSPNAPEYDN